MSRSAHLVSFALLLPLLLPPPAHATDFNWDRGAGTNNWADSANWLPNGVPGLSDALLLTGASLPGPQTIDVAGNQRIDHIFTNGLSGLYTFTNSAPATSLEIFRDPATGASALLTQNHNGALIFDTNINLAHAGRFYFNVDQGGSKMTFNPGRTISTSASSGTATLNLTGRNATLDYALEVHSTIADGPGARIALEAGLASDALNHRARVLLTGNNTYTGPTTVNGVTLAFTSIADIGAGPSALGNPTTLPDATIRLGTDATAPDNIPGTLRYVGTNPAGHSSNRPFQFVGFSPGGIIESSGAGPLTLSGGLTSTSSTTNHRTLTLAGTNTSLNTFSGVIADVPGSAVQNLIKNGPGTWSLSAANTYLGTTTVNSGTLIVGPTGSIGSAASPTGAVAVIAGALRLDGGSITTANFNNSASFEFRSGTLQLTSAGTIVAPFVIGTLGPGTLISGGALTAGTIQLQGPDDTLNITGGELAVDTLDNSAGGSLTLAAAAQLSLDDSQSGLTTASGTVAGPIAGPGRLTKVGNGTLVVSSHLSHFGPTTVNGGILRVTSTGQLSDFSPVVVNSPGTLEFNAVPAAAVFNLSGDGVVNLLNNSRLTAGSFALGNGNGTFAGLIQGNGSLAKRGDGNLTLTGINTYTGSTSIEQGTLTITSIADVGATPTSLGAPTTALLGTIDIALAGQFATLRYAGTDPAGHSSNRRINLPGGTAAIDASGAGPLTLTGDVIAIGSANRTLILAGSNSADNTYAGVIPAITGSPTLGLQKTGTGRWVLSAPNTYDGSTTITAGELLVRGPNGAINGPGVIDVAAAATLTLDGGSISTPDLDVSGTFLFRSGTLTLGNGSHTFPAGSNLTIGTHGPASMTLGAGTSTFDALTLHGPDDSLAIPAGTTTLTTLDNSHGGTLVITGGTLSINTGGQLITPSGTLAGAVTGAGGLTKTSDGSPTGGTLTMAAGISHSYTGPTQINAGTLLLAGASDHLSADTTVTIAPGAALDLRGSDGEAIGALAGAGTVFVGPGAPLTVGQNQQTTTFSGSITGAGDFHKSRSGTLILEGVSDHTGSTSLDAGGGTLIIRSGGAITSTSQFIFGPSTTLVLGHATLGPGSLTTSSLSPAGDTSNLTWIAGTLRLTGAAGLQITRFGQIGGNRTLTAGQHLVVDATTTVATGTIGTPGPPGALAISGGSLTTGSLLVESFATFTFTSGAFTLTRNTTLNAGLLASADLERPIGPGRTFGVTAAATIAAPLTLAGGTLNFTTLLQPENLILSSGTLNVTNPLTVAANKSLNASPGMTINAAGGLQLASNAQFNAIGANLNSNAPSTAAGPINSINSALHFPAGLTTSAPITLISSTITGSVHSTSTITTAGLTTLPKLTGSPSLTISGPTTLPPDSGPSTLASLSIAPGASLDLTSTTLLLTAGAPDAYLGLPSIRDYLSSGQLVSSTPDPTATHSLGYLQTPAGLLIQLTPTGDANLNGLLDPDDLTLLDKGYLTNGAFWWEGDFNHDGAITPADYLLLDRAFGQAHGFSPGFLSQRQSQFGPQYISALLTTIPEPSTLIPVAIVAFGALFPRRPR